MKYLLVFLLIMCISSCDGQKSSIDSLIFVKGVSTSTSAKDSVTILGSGYGFVGDGGTILFHKQDTIKVLMLVCDTSGWVTTGVAWRDSTILNNYRAKWYNKSTWWQFGYEVRGGIISGSYILYVDKDGNLIREPTIKYFDQNKKPLPKSIIVWMTKEINQQ